MGSRGLRCMLLHPLILGSRIHPAATAAVPPSLTASVSSGGWARCSSSGTSFLFDKYADSPENLVELMRRIVRRGGKGRKQDNVPKEVGHNLYGVLLLLYCLTWWSSRRLCMLFWLHRMDSSIYSIACRLHASLGGDTRPVSRVRSGSVGSCFGVEVVTAGHFRWHMLSSGVVH